MRFEFSANDVQNQVWILRFLFDLASKSNLDLMALDQIINSGSAMIRKIVDYGYEGFRTRDEFRITTISLKDWVEEIKKLYLKKQKEYGSRHLKGND